MEGSFTTQEAAHSHTHVNTHTLCLSQLLFYAFSIFLALPPPLYPSPSRYLSEWDLWSKISAVVMPFWVDWQMIQPALWAPVGVATDQYPSWLPVSIHTNMHTCSHTAYAHTHKHTHTHTHTHKAFTCKASIKAHLSRLAFTGTGPGCVQHSRRGHSRDSSQPRGAACLGDYGAEEFSSQIPLAPPAG